MRAESGCLRKGPAPARGSEKLCCEFLATAVKGCLDEIEVHIPEAHEFSSDIEQVCFFNATILGIFFIAL